MFRCIALLRRRPGLSKAEFIAYYEERHAVLIDGLFPDIVAYRRNYIDHDGAIMFPGAPPIDFDAVTEITFPDRAAYERFLATAAEPGMARLIAEDEANVFDRSAIRMFPVEERSSARSNDPQLRMLLDEREIVRALADFARILDTKRWDRLAEVFAADVVFDYGSGGHQHGLHALSAHVRSFLDRCGGTQHLIGSIRVDVAGDAAVSRSYVQARHQRSGDAAGPVFDSNGEYIDRWARLAEGWRIVRRDAVWATHSGDPAVLHTEAGNLG